MRKTRACLDQLLIVIRSLLIVCDHVLIVINRPIAINLSTRRHDGVLSIKCRWCCLAEYKHHTRMGRAGRWGVSESVAAAAAAHVVLHRPSPLIDNRTICCRSCCPAARPSECQSLQHSILTDKFPEDDTASANTTAWKVAVSIVRYSSE